MADEEIRIKEELFNLLSLFILTFEMRSERVQSIIRKNSDKMIKKVLEFKEQDPEEEIRGIMDLLANKLEKI